MKLASNYFIDTRGVSLDMLEILTNYVDNLEEKEGLTFHLLEIKGESDKFETYVEMVTKTSIPLMTYKVRFILCANMDLFIHVYDYEEEMVYTTVARGNEAPASFAREVILAEV